MAWTYSPTAPEAPATLGQKSLPLSHQATLTGTDTVEQLTDDVLYFQQATLWGYSGFADNKPTFNTASVYAGFGPPDEDGNVNLFCIVPPGGKVVIEAPRGQKFCLSDLYFSGAATDGLFITYC